MTKVVFKFTSTLMNKVTKLRDQFGKSWLNKHLQLLLNQIEVSYIYLPEVESRTQGSRPRPRTQKKIRGQGQGQPFRGQTLSRPRTEMLEAKDQGHKRKCSPKEKKKGLHKNVSGDLLKKKKGFPKIFQAISTKRRFPKNFSSTPQNFNNSKNSAVLEPRTGQFSRT